mmetsp:Transcript_31562/g.38890  ORF Transcript_31562/g.38890 Transcript_31562/m.38890 type:complete len:107 (-) Transcript_31562:285-605(-)
MEYSLILMESIMVICEFFKINFQKYSDLGAYIHFLMGFALETFFFHGVACQIVQLELENLGFQTEFHPIPVDSKVKEDTTWEGVKNKYWHMDSYYLPVALFKPQSK